jgi:hypothetical protein
MLSHLTKEQAFAKWCGAGETAFYWWLGQQGVTLHMNCQRPLDEVEAVLLAQTDALRLLVVEQPEGDWEVSIGKNALQMRRVFYDERWHFTRLWCRMQAELALGILSPEKHPNLYKQGLLPQEWVTLEVSLRLVRELGENVKCEV